MVMMVVVGRVCMCWVLGSLGRGIEGWDGNGMEAGVLSEKGCQIRYFVAKRRYL